MHMHVGRYVYLHLRQLRGKIDYRAGAGEGEGGWRGRGGGDVVEVTPIEVATVAAATVMEDMEGSILADPPAPLSVIEKNYILGKDRCKCMFPMCGGWWGKIVNEEITRCVGGVDANECYVAEIDLGDLHEKVVSVYLFSGGNLVL